MRPFFEDLKGDVIDQSKTANPSWKDFEQDWTKFKLYVLVEQVGEVNLVDYAIRDEKFLASQFTKTRRSAVPKPLYGMKYKSDERYVKFISQLRQYVNAGGNASILEIVGEDGAKSFADTLGLHKLDLGFVSMKEIIVLILFVKYRPLKYDECVKELGALKLDFFGYETMIDNVNNYINSVKKVLRGRPFMKKLAESLLVNWAVIYHSWCAEMTEVGQAIEVKSCY